MFGQLNYRSKNNVTQNRRKWPLKIFSKNIPIPSNNNLYIITKGWPKWPLKVPCLDVFNDALMAHLIFLIKWAISTVIVQTTGTNFWNEL